MFLAIDVGNSNIHIGLFQEKKNLQLLKTQIFPSSNYGISQLCAMIKRQKSLNGIILSDARGKTAISHKKIFKQVKALLPNFIILTPDMKYGLKINYHPKLSLGTDRIADCVAAYRLFKKDCLVVDFGTATTLNVVTKHREFLGGLILPGITGLIQALPSHLVTKEITRKSLHHNLLSQTTLQSVYSGLYFLVINTIERIKYDMQQHLKTDLYTVATGGGINLVPKIKNIFNNIDAHLTLKGLAIIYQNIKEL